MSGRPQRERKQTKQEHMVDSDKAVGDLRARDLLVPGADESQIAQAQIEWNHPEETRESAIIMYEFQRTQAQAASGATAAAAPMPPPAAAAAPRSPIVIDISSDEEQDGAAVAQSPQASRSHIAKPTPPKTLQETGRQSNAPDYDPSTHPQPGLNTAAPALTLEVFGRRSNADRHKRVASSEQAVQDDSQEILLPPSSQDAGDAGSQSSVRADWNYPNSGNGAAATADDANDVPAAAGVKRKADDANEVPVFGGNNGGNGGNGAGRTFAVQPDGSALRTDTHANGTKQTSRWTSTGHGQWEKHH